MNDDDFRAHGLGMPRDEVTLREHDPRWAAAFARLSAECPGLELEHVGSTSIPGICAKPILDAVGVHGPAPAGFVDEAEYGIPDRRFCVRYDAAERESFAHLHLFPRGHFEIARHRDFRDRLRADEALARQYQTLKRGLPRERGAYLEGKADFISSVVGRILLRTERMVLREFTAHDAQHLFDLDADPEVMRYLTGGPGTPMEEVRGRIIPKFLEGYRKHPGLGFWAAIETSTGSFLGWFHFRPDRTNPEDLDIGWRLRRAAWGRGLATEGAREIVKRAGGRRVVAYTLEANAASRRVMEKIGMTVVRRFHEPRHPGNPPALMYAL